MTNVHFTNRLKHNRKRIDGERQKKKQKPNLTTYILRTRNELTDADRLFVYQETKIFCWDTIARQRIYTDDTDKKTMRL